MKLEVFRAGKGDAMLLTTVDGKRMLVDGGQGPAFRDHVRPTLAKLNEEGAALDVVYVSHIDDDHIAGVLQLFEDHVDWRFFDFQHARGNARVKEPKQPRPPQVHELWHNGFGDLLGDDAPPIEEAVAMTAGLLEASPDPEDRKVAAEHQELVESVGQGIELSRRAAPDQLGIELNKPFGDAALGHKLALVRDEPQTIALGTAKLTLIGPFPEDVEKLRVCWKRWLATMTRQLADLRARMQRDSDRLTTDFDRIRGALDLGATVLGNRADVTVPNLASIMFFVEEGERTLLLTGDGHSSDILKGLERAKRIKSEGSLHVDVLKVQHHGSEHNLDEKFAQRVIADRYVFCADGLHENPDPAVLKAIVASRQSDDPNVRSGHRKAAEPYEFHFNTAPELLSGTRREHFDEVKRVTDEAVAASNGQLSCEFHPDSSFELPV